MKIRAIKATGQKSPVENGEQRRRYFGFANTNILATLDDINCCDEIPLLGGQRPPTPEGD